MEILLNENAEYWHNKDFKYSKSHLKNYNFHCCDIETIFKENPLYNRDLFCELNKYVITEDSQENHFIEFKKTNKLNHYYVKFLNEAWGYNYAALKKNNITQETQVPYLEFTTSNKNGDLLWNNINDSLKYCVHRVNKTTNTTNHLMISLTKQFEKLYDLKNIIPLTYLKLRDPVFNKLTNNKSNYIFQTNYSLDSLNNLEEYPNDADKFYIIGKDNKIDINDMFLDLINIFKK